MLQKCFMINIGNFNNNKSNNNKKLNNKNNNMKEVIARLILQLRLN